MRRLFTLTALVLFCWNVKAQQIYLVAGTKEKGYEGEDKPAKEARLFHPMSMVFDGNGSMFFADQSNHTIRKIDPEGNLSTFMGDGRLGVITYPQTQGVRFYAPAALAFDRAGDLLVADKGNHAIRKIDMETKEVSVISGNGHNGESGDGAAASEALLNNPCDLAVDVHGNIFIADRGNHRIRKIDINTNIITTVAGTGAPGYNGDGISATQAQLNGPTSVDVDKQGNIYICDMNNCRVRKVDAATGLISTIAGNGRPTSKGENGWANVAKLRYPFRVRVDELGNIFIAEPNNHMIRLVTTEGKIFNFISPDSEGQVQSPFLPYSLKKAAGLSITNDGTLWIADTDNHRLLKCDNYLNIVSDLVSKSAPPTEIVLGSRITIEELEGEWAMPIRARDKDRNDTHNYALVEGDGDKDNEYFEVKNNILILKKPIFKEALNIRLAVKDQTGNIFEQSLRIPNTLASR